MTSKQIEYPVKKFEVENFWYDSTTWNDFQFRQDDIVIDTYPKSGTTWMQQIVGQLIFNGQENVNIQHTSPCLDLCWNIKAFGSKEQLLQALDKQIHRRFVKSHLPLDALVFSTKAKYIFVVRDGRDVVYSLYNHLVNVIIEGHQRSVSLHELFQTRILGKSDTSFFQHIRSCWNIRHLPNVLLVHFAQLKKDLSNEIKRVARFLQIESDCLDWDSILKHCSFDYMKDHAVNFIEDKYFLGGATTFFCHGTNDRWKDVLTKEEIQAYETRALEELGEEGARWLMTGEQLQTDQSD